MIKYVKCPRCELNYIDADKQEYCDVCIAEMKGNKLQFADLEDEDFEKVIENEGAELCPVCGVNYISYGEKTCEFCKNKEEYDDEGEVDPENDEQWKNYLDDDTEDLSLEDAALDEELKEELEEEDEEEEESEESGDDFFDEDLESLDDYDDEDDEDDEDDDDDLF